MRPRAVVLTTLTRASIGAEKYTDHGNGCKSMDGLDTGFFFDLWEKTVPAQTLWEEITVHDEPAAVSTISLFEISRHALAGRLGRPFTDTIIQRSGAAFQQAPVDPVDVVRRAARMTHGMGLPMADAMIAASLESVGCDRLVTTDSDFEQYEGEMDVILL